MILGWDPRFTFNYNNYIDNKNVVFGDELDDVRDMLKSNQNINMYRCDSSFIINESNIKFEEKSREEKKSYTGDVITQGMYNVFPDYNNSPDELSNFEFELKNCNITLSFLIGYHEINCSPKYVDKFLNVAFDKNAIDNSFGIYDYVPLKFYIQFLEKKPNFEIKCKFKAGYLQLRDRNVILSQRSIITDNMIYGTGCFNVQNPEKKMVIPIY